MTSPDEGRLHEPCPDDLPCPGRGGRRGAARGGHPRLRRGEPLGELRRRRARRPGRTGRRVPDHRVRPDDGRLVRGPGGRAGRVPQPGRHQRHLQHGDRGCRQPLRRDHHGHRLHAGPPAASRDGLRALQRPDGRPDVLHQHGGRRGLPVHALRHRRHLRRRSRADGRRPHRHPPRCLLVQLRRGWLGAVGCRHPGRRPARRSLGLRPVRARDARRAPAADLARGGCPVHHHGTRERGSRRRGRRHLHRHCCR